MMQAAVVSSFQSLMSPLICFEFGSMLIQDQVATDSVILSMEVAEVGNELKRMLQQPQPPQPPLQRLEFEDLFAAVGSSWLLAGPSPLHLHMAVIDLSFLEEDSEALKVLKTKEQRWRLQNCPR